MALNTVEDWVRRCASELDSAAVHFGHGTDNALDEAAWLVLAALDEPVDGSFGDWSRPVSGQAAAAVEELLQRRIASRQPLAYLLGRAWFCGLEFRAGPAALVPRSPIAELIGRGFAPWVDADRVHRVLDLCTGSGCIAVAMAVYFPHWRIDATDISEEALALARENVRLHGVGERVRLLRSDLFDALGDRRYDLIVSNPPYVPDGEVRKLPAEYEAEPALGLRSGSDGLDLPLGILARCAGHLEPGGVLVCEVGESRGRLEALLPRAPFTWIEFEQGGDGVFTMSRNELESVAPDARALLETRNHVP